LGARNSAASARTVIASPAHRHASLRRRLAARAVGLALIAGIGARGASFAAQTVDVWVDLHPAAGAAPGTDPIREQQDRVMRELSTLGAVELARVRHARNAIAVRLPSDRLEAVRGIAGVVRVRPLDTLHPPRITPSP
jgi:hypothetical protein